MKKFALIFFIFIVTVVTGQNSDSTFVPKYRHGVLYRLQTTSGLTYTGFIVDETRDYVTIENRSTHERSELLKKELVSSAGPRAKVDVEESVYGTNSHAGAYMLSNSAFLFEEGHLTSNGHWFLFENLDYAFNENWAVCANSLVFYPISFGVKCAYKVGDISYVGGNLMVFGNPSSYNGNGAFFMGYAGMLKYTRGTTNNNFTIAAGVLGLNSSVFLTATDPYVNLSFASAAYCKRLSKRTALNLEGWFMPEISTGLGGVGIKLLEDERTSWTFGCFSFVHQQANKFHVNLRSFPIPYFGLTRKFE